MFFKTISMNVQNPLNSFNQNSHTHLLGLEKCKKNRIPFIFQHVGDSIKHLYRESKNTLSLFKIPMNKL